MVKVDQYARIRHAHALDGMSIKALARQFHHSRRKIREILASAEPKPYVRLNPPPTLLEPFQPIIDAILAADEQAPPKQRHTAAKIFRRLRAEHGYPGGYDRVRLYVRQKARRHRETFIPLDHDPGQRLEADFGHIYVDFPDGRRQVPVLHRDLGVLELPLRHRPADRTHRGHPARHGRGVSVLRLRAARGVVGQPHDGGAHSCSTAGSACSTHATRRWPATTASSRSSAGCGSRRRSHASKAACGSCSGSGPRRCRRFATWPR